MSIRFTPLYPISHIFFCFFLLSCAGQVPPGGGPPDTDPPQIISTSPVPYTTLFRGTGIVLEFNEYVDRRSVEESIFISPSVGELSYDWSGTEVEVQFSEPLRENTTYVVNVGTDVVDIRNKNRMSQAFSLAFSTGSMIDRGAITGRVYPLRHSDSPEGVMVFAYRLEGSTPDTTNPRVHRPDYVTQTGKEGKFSLYHLVLGIYRVYAIRDEYRNFLYDPETDEYGTLPADVHLSESDTLSGGLTIQLAKEDTTKPRLIKVTPLNARLLTVEFSEPIETTSVVGERFSLADTIGGQAIAVRVVAAVLPKRTEFFLATDPMSEGIAYQLRVDGVKDGAGLTVSGLASIVQFEGSGQSDTTRPDAAGFSIPDSVRNIPLQPDLIVFLTEPVQHGDVAQMVNLQDSTGTSVAGRADWLNAAAITFRAGTQLAKKAWYRFSLNIPMLVDPSGNRGLDTMRSLRFETIDADRFSSIEGIVRDENRSDTGRIYLLATNTSQRDDPGTIVSISGPGQFLIQNIVEGQYTVRAFRDRNGDGFFDAGNVHPFVPSERFSFYRDTLRVRARWPLEGVVLELR